MLVKLIWQGKISKSHLSHLLEFVSKRFTLQVYMVFERKIFIKIFPIYFQETKECIFSLNIRVFLSCDFYHFVKYYSVFFSFFMWKVPDDRDLGPVRIEDIVNCEWTCIFVGKKNIHNVSSGLFSIHAEESKTKHSKIIDCFPKD